ncbi:hypothetical protein BB559_004336 [Furculomyces boomerangus]|uniref:Uncharacterized protein n=2 Tax=Harpellales TaxID=61421 RepID=A0A2T9YFC4_9FUNG|nr:hypothetical protein BB559_004336 [Furculomyces boomerangus]
MDDLESSENTEFEVNMTKFTILLCFCVVYVVFAYTSWMLYRLRFRKYLQMNLNFSNHIVFATDGLLLGGILVVVASVMREAYYPVSFNFLTLWLCYICYPIYYTTHLVFGLKIWYFSVLNNKQIEYMKYTDLHIKQTKLGNTKNRYTMQLPESAYLSALKQAKEYICKKHSKYKILGSVQLVLIAVMVYFYWALGLCIVYSHTDLYGVKSRSLVLGFDCVYFVSEFQAVAIYQVFYFAFCAPILVYIVWPAEGVYNWRDSFVYSQVALIIISFAKLVLYYFDPKIITEKTLLHFLDVVPPIITHFFIVIWPMATTRLNVRYHKPVREYLGISMYTKSKVNYKKIKKMELGDINKGIKNAFFLKKNFKWLKIGEKVYREKFKTFVLNIREKEYIKYVEDCSKLLYSSRYVYFLKEYQKLKKAICSYLVIRNSNMRSMLMLTKELVPCFTIPTGETQHQSTTLSIRVSRTFRQSSQLPSSKKISRMVLPLPFTISKNLALLSTKHNIHTPISSSQQISNHLRKKYLSIYNMFFKDNAVLEIQTSATSLKSIHSAFTKSQIPYNVFDKVFTLSLNYIFHLNLLYMPENTKLWNPAPQKQKKTHK